MLKNLEYYTKPVDYYDETQCVLDLLAGKIKISDVPFEFRNDYAYNAAHKYARGLVDEKERYYQYWKIAECMERDMQDLDIAEITQGKENPTIKQSVEIPEESEYFNIKNRILELKYAHERYFEFATRKTYF